MISNLVFAFAGSFTAPLQEAAPQNPLSELAPEQAFDLERTQEILTVEIERTLALGVASVSIALVREDEIVWTAAFGHANVWAQTLATPETIYCTGSTFKAVTATAILQLAERGLLSLDDPVNQHLGADVIADLEAHPVTIRHILSHTSGLNAGANTVPLWARELPLELTELSASLAAVRPPEELYEYNNYAYGLAGHVIETVSGQDFEAYVVEHILQPLGVTTPGPVHPTPEMVERMALPYRLSADGPEPVAQVRFDVYPAGDIWLTADDMARFLAAHLNGGSFAEQSILSEESVAEAHRPQFFNYGLGWGVDPARPQIISHAGGVPGFSTFMIGDLEARVGVYIMSNSGDMSSIARAGLKLLRGEQHFPTPERTFIALPVELLDTYVGEYRVEDDVILAITREADRLYVQRAGQPRTDLRAEAEAHFYVLGLNAEVRFLSGPGGAVDRLILNQNGRDYEAVRIE